MSEPATRYRCLVKDRADWQSPFHAQGNGKPRAKWCTYCHGQLLIERGWHGVFEHSGGTGRYPASDAVKVFASPTAAQRYADGNGDNLVVRWIPDLVLGA